MKSSTRPLPNPPRFGPGARRVATSTGRLRMPVNPTVLAALGSRLPRLTEAT